MKIYLEYELPEAPKEFKTVSDFGFENMMQKHKYRTLWQLRSIEQEINESNGMIIIHSNGRIEIKCFTQELNKKIQDN
jgi:hypothetical protein